MAQVHQYGPPFIEGEITSRTSDEALFHLDAGRFVPSELALGPWDPAALHGGASAGLLARVIERHDSPTDVPHMVARLTIEMLRPVPLEPLTQRTRVVRRGRRAHVLEASLLAGDREVCRATALRIRAADVKVPGRRDDPPKGPDFARVQTEEWSRRGFHNAGIEIRFPEYEGRAQTSAWIRLNHAVVRGEQTSPLMQIAAAADFGNGIGAVLRLDRYRFINPDLTIYLTRYPTSEWTYLDATTHLGPNGVGLADTELYDVEGRIGRSVQALLVEPV